MTERCARCPAWSFSGTAAECLEAGRKHRAGKHPETVGWKRPKVRKVKRQEPEEVPAAVSKPVPARKPRVLRAAPAPAPQSSWRQVGNRLTPERLAVAVELYEAGLTLRGICDVAAARWDFTESSLRFHLAKRLPAAGVVMRSRGRAAPPAQLSDVQVAGLLDGCDRVLAA